MKLGIEEQNKGNARNGMEILGISVGMRGNLCGIVENVGSQCGDAGNQDRNVGIAIEIT